MKKMSNMLYQLYRDKRTMLVNFKSTTDNYDEIQDVIDHAQTAIEVIEQSHPEIAERYEQYIAMQKSFTPEQVDFICYQIGDWYLEWKKRIIVDLEDGTHRLGFAKERLKELICGS